MGLTAIVRVWLVDLWSLLHASPLALVLPSAVLTLPALTVFLASLAAVIPRVVYVAWRTFAFVQRRRRAARIPARLATA